MGLGIGVTGLGFGESNGKRMENNMETGIIQGFLETVAHIMVPRVWVQDVGTQGVCRHYKGIEGFLIRGFVGFFLNKTLGTLAPTNHHWRLGRAYVV